VVRGVHHAFAVDLRVAEATFFGCQRVVGRALEAIERDVAVEL